MEHRGGKRIGAGRKKGTRNPATLEKERVLAAYRQQILAHAKELFEMQINLARQGNHAAIESMLNRTFGKPKESVEVSSGGEDFWAGFMRNKKDEPLARGDGSGQGVT